MCCGDETWRKTLGTLVLVHPTLSMEQGMFSKSRVTGTGLLSPSATPWVWAFFLGSIPHKANSHAL